MAYLTLTDVKTFLESSTLSAYDNIDAVIAEFISQVEAEVNGQLRAMGYTTVPVTSAADVAVAQGVCLGFIIDRVNAVKLSADVQKRSIISNETLDKLRRGEMVLEAGRSATSFTVAL